MSWSIEQHIGELRPWPDSVRVVRGKDEESRRYVPEPQERIVRCKDCRYGYQHDCTRYPQDKRYMGKWYCIAWGDGMQGEWTKADGFCHRGKPREDS